MSAILQILVSWGEFLGGAAILLGFLTELASLGIIIIMTGAIITIHGKNGFGMMNHGFEYNYALIAMALALIASGPGPFSIGCGCQCKKK
jgi:putative oxidoreductase